MADCGSNPPGETRRAANYELEPAAAAAELGAEEGEWAAAGRAVPPSSEHVGGMVKLVVTEAADLHDGEAGAGAGVGTPRYELFPDVPVDLHVCLDVRRLPLSLLPLGRTGHRFHHLYTIRGGFPAGFPTRLLPPWFLSASAA